MTEKIEKFRRHAADAESSARRATTDRERFAYQQIAETWKHMAAEREAELTHPEDLDDDREAG